jgi:Flp pilus assembly protein TadG
MVIAQRRRTPRTSRRRGVATVEAALFLPVVLLFIMGVIDYGRYFLMVHVCGNAVSTGAAYACNHTSPVVLNGTSYGNGTSNVTNIVNATIGSQQSANPTVSVYLSDANGNPVADSAGNNPGLFTYATAGSYVCVLLTGTFTFVPSTFLKLPPTFMAVRRSEGN